MTKRSFDIRTFDCDSGGCAGECASMDLHPRSACFAHALLTPPQRYDIV
jgi:hypothetical protein